MLIRSLRDEESESYNQVVNHPLQSWEWGEFRKTTGVSADRLGFYKNGKLDHALQVTFHPIPIINKTAGYLPKGFMPDEDQLAALKKLGLQYNALFIKLEPNVSTKIDISTKTKEASTKHPNHAEIQKFLLKHGCVPGKPLFTKYTFELDLALSEEDLFAKLNSKTRYNIRLAQKRGVEVFENTNKEGLETYIKILEATTSRQGFYAHGPDYFRKMWDKLGNAGNMKIFQAVYNGQVLVSWIMFVFNDILYYPYGASIREHREVMASNLMMWEMIRFGKKIKAKKLDMWGSLGPDPDKKNPWYGFHRFKKGYGGDLMEFVGTYDLVINQPLYKLFRIADDLRWKFLRLKAKLKL